MKIQRFNINNALLQQSILFKQSLIHELPSQKGEKFIKNRVYLCPPSCNQVFINLPKYFG